MAATIIDRTASSLEGATRKLAVILAALVVVATSSQLTAVRGPLTRAAQALIDRSSPSARMADITTRQNAEKAYGKLPLRFEANRGQTDSQVKFLSRGTREPVFLTAIESVITLPVATGANDETAANAVRMRLVGSNPKPQLAGEKRLPGVTNYFLGKNPNNWVTGVESYGRVRYRDAYPGIDLVYRGDDQGRLEYDLVVGPGADPAIIKLAFQGVDELLIEDGQLVLKTATGEVRQHAPVIFQELGGRRAAIDGRYVLDGRGGVRFEVGAYDHSRTLTIDPVITSATYLGGSRDEEPRGVATDATGAAYITGTTTSIDFPLPPGASLDKTCGTNGNCDSAPPLDPRDAPTPPKPDVFVSKLSPDGSTLIFSTYLGGAGNDGGLGIAVDQAGSAYLTGRTDSADFPTRNAFDDKCGTDAMGTCDSRRRDASPSQTETRPDMFVAKLNPAGTELAYSTYLGGSGDDARAGAASYSLAAGSVDQPGDEVSGLHPGTAGGIAVDSAGNAYVSGSTLSADFPTTANAYDPTCGSDGACSRTELNNVYESTCATDAGCQTREATNGRVLRFQPDAFVVKLDTTKAGGASLSYASHLGGSGAEAAFGIAVWADASGDVNAFLTGFSTSPKPGQAPYPPDVILTTTTPDPSNPTTYPPNEEFPTTTGAFLTERPDQVPPEALREFIREREFSIAFVSRINLVAPRGQALRYSTLLGGVGPAWNTGAGGSVPKGETGAAIAVDAAGKAYVTGQTDSGERPSPPSGSPRLVDFPVKAPAGLVPVQDRLQLDGNSCGTCLAAFFSKLDTTVNGASSLVYSTYLGGRGGDRGLGVALDGAGTAYVAGEADGTFPTKESVWEGGAGRRAFLAAISPERAQPDGSTLVYSSFFAGDQFDPGGDIDTEGTAVAIWTDASTQSAHAYLVGWTGANNLPLVNPYQHAAGGAKDGFVARISPPPSTPFVTGIMPGTGSSSGGDEVLINGTGLLSEGATTVSFGGAPAQVLEVSASQVKVVSPPGADFVEVRVNTALGASPVTSVTRFTYVDGTWAGAPDSPMARYGHTATPLPDGSILVIGGVNGSVPTASSVALYRPNTGTWIPCAAMSPPPSGTPSCPSVAFGPGHSATLLSGPNCGANCGKILVVRSSTAMLYRPVDGTWEGASPPKRPRTYSTATLLSGPNCGDNCGKVLFVGGVENVRDDLLTSSGTAELFNPVDTSFTLIAPQRDDRLWQHTATLISGPGCEGAVAYPDCGKVLVVGGASKTGTIPESSGSAELYDPALGAWTARRGVVARYGHTATVLSTGKVLVTGGLIATGRDNYGRALTATEIYDPSKGAAAGLTVGQRFDEAFSPGGALLTARSGHVVVPLPAGRALVMGGAGDLSDLPAGPRPPLASAEIYDPQLGAGRGAWRQAPPLVAARGAGPMPGGHTATVIGGLMCAPLCGKVLVFGGTADSRSGFSGGGFDSYRPAALASAQLYTPGPSISSIDPAVGPAAGGQKVVISGTGFVADLMTDPRSVAFGGVAAQSFTVDSPTQITAFTPPAGEEPKAGVRVLVRGLGAATFGFDYQEAAGAVLDLAARTVSGKEILLSFTAPGFPPASEYVVKQSRSPITAADFDGAQDVCEGGVCRYTVRRYREILTVSVSGLTPETTYFYALRSKGSDGAFGPISNVASDITSNVTPGAVGDLAATAVNDGEVRLTFSAPGSNGADGPPAIRYVVKQATAPIADAQSFEQATALCEGGVCRLQPGAVGEGLSLSVGGLQRDTIYHYALRALDEAGNLGPISNLASAAPDCVAPMGGVGRVVYGGGYRLVSLPEGTRVPAQSVLYSWFNLGRGGRYSTQAADQPVASGRGYWAWFSCPRSVELGAGTASASSPLTAFRASMVGNPSGTSPAVISGHDFTARWDPSANSGGGGYQVSGYRQNQTLAVGEGIWAFSYQDTTLSVSAQ